MHDNQLQDKMRHACSEIITEHYFGGNRIIMIIKTIMQSCSAAVYSQIVEVVHALCYAADGSKELNVHLLVTRQPDHLHDDAGVTTIICTSF